MKRIVTHMLVAVGLAAGVVGVAQAHTDLHVGIGLGAPAPAVYAPQPVYYGHPGWDRHEQYRHDRWEQRHYDRGWHGDRGGYGPHRW